MPEDNRLDLVINEALASYGDPGPDSELPARMAGRIAACIASEPTPKPRGRRLLWAVALPAAACVTLMVFVHPGPRITRPRVIQSNQAGRLGRLAVAARGAQAQPAPRVAAAERAKARAPRLRAEVAAAAQSLPKLDVFPTPQPLTPQERALAVYVAQMPEPEQRALAQSEQDPVPLTVASIHTLPLEPPDATLPNLPEVGDN